MSETNAPEAPGLNRATPNLNKALSLLQGELPKVTKTKEGKIEGQTKDGKFFSYKYGYADLTDVTATVGPLLAKHGLAFHAAITRDPADKREMILAWSLLHESGEERSGEWPLGPANQKAQSLGSAITYGRRYCLGAATGIVAEDDDDGQSAQREHGNHQSAADAFESAAPARPHSVAAAPPARDEEWLDAALASAASLPTVDKCREMWRQSSGKVHAGEVDKADAGRVQAILAARIDELGRTVIDPEHPWAPKVDGLATTEEAVDALAELTGLFKSGGIDETLANQARNVILIRFPQAAEVARAAA